MRYYQILEGVQINSKIKLAAYAVTVAEAYDAAPISDGSSAWTALNTHNNEVLLKRLKADVNVVYTPDDPYEILDGNPSDAIKLMLFDILVNRQLKIWSGASDNHPVFSAEDNVVFRTVHDYFTHAKLLNSFKAGLKQVLQGRKTMPTDQELTKLLPKIDLSKKGNVGHAFSLRGELNAYSSHMQLAPRAATPALFTEVVGQVCYKVVCDTFPEQKASVLQGGFDYGKVGLCTHGEAAEHRMLEVSSLIMTGQPELKLNLKAKPLIATDDLLTQIVS